MRPAAALRIDPENDLRVEDRDQGLEIALARGGEEGIGHLTLAAEVGVRGWGPALDPAAGAASELSRRGRRAVDDRCDLVERHGEHVVQHEGEPLGRLERVEYDEHATASSNGSSAAMAARIMQLRGAHG
jgi:hypothetical protein